MFAGSLWVVVPFYNEANGIEPTIQALARQADGAFMLLLVNNTSTDDSVAVVKRAIKKYGMAGLVLDEPQKGTGAAADTGFRYAIAHGATHVARTDADCLPDQHWVAEIKLAFSEGLEFIGGKIKPRGDDIQLTHADRIILPLLVMVCEWYGKLFWRGKQFRYTFFMAAGNNLAIEADLYQRAGGFVRSAIDDTDEDKILAEKVRTLTANGAFRKRMIVYNSIRRARKYGYIKILRWYWNRHYRGEVDIR